MFGAKQNTEATDFMENHRVVGKRSIFDEGRPEGVLESIEVRMQA